MNELSPVKRALLEQRRLKARIEELEQRQSEPLAVIGVGCRFPGDVDGPASFWALLHAGVDAISAIPPERLDVSRHYDPDPEAPGKIATRLGGFLASVDQFDAHVFGISPREATTMDPQQRLLLEVSWEALEHAGCAPDRLSGSSTGVFVGIGTSDYLQQFAQKMPLEEIDAYLATGNAHSVASGRISYLLGLHGPSLAVDTACSSSLVAIHLACESLRAGGCDRAIAGGVGILLSLENYVTLSKARMMAPDGRCKTFDARADGFVRSEGCGMVVLKRLSDARRDDDRILAVVRGTACNQDGRSNGITAPNGPAQQAVIRAALANAGVDPGAVSYVETHGTGTVLGDPIEVESLSAILGPGRSAADSLHLGSVKTNLGHMEAAAGVGGFIKTVLALKHRTIPPNLHFREPNPHIAWSAHPYLQVPTAPLPWTPAGGRRLAGVSAFGFSGTNVHLVLEEAPAAETAASTVERPLHVLALSGRTPAALARAAADLAAHLTATPAALADVCHSVNTGRAALTCRALLIARTTTEMVAELERLRDGTKGRGTHTGEAVDGDKPAVLFAFAGSASKDLALARELFATQPVFRVAIEECDAKLTERGSPLVADALSGASGTATPAVAFAIHCALASLWRAWGVAPAAVLGEGTGEIAAATVASVLTPDDALGLLASGGAVAAAPPLVPVFSARLGRRASPAELASAEHWARVAVPGTGSAAARQAALGEGFPVVLEMGGESWSGLLDRLAELYVRGAPIDWRGFDRGYARERVDVPASPFLRQRFWFDDGEPRAPADSAWEDVVAAATRQAAQVPIDVQLTDYDALWRELDAVTTDVVARAAQGLGLFRKSGERHTAESAIAAGRVLPMYRDVMTHWLRRLTRAGLLTAQGDAFVATAPLPSDPRARPTPMLDREPLFRAYVDRCERALVSIARGESHALAVLFPEGSLETADFFYRGWGLARYFNAIAESVASVVGRAAAGRGLRVLEVGAGTGGTTESVLRALPSAGTEYWFTDMSLHFFGRAEESFSRYPFLRFAKFDLDEPPEAQGIPGDYFDLVIAANAVHATRDLDRSIRHLRSLVAPGGTLLLYEVTRDFEWFEMSWALVEGWQRHADALRRETPLLSPERWTEVLRERGFDRAQAFPERGSPAEVLGHHIVIATRPDEGRRATSAAATSTTTAVVAQAPKDGAPPLRERLLELTPGERHEEISRMVHAQVTRVMRLGPADASPGLHDRLMNIGVDSLMAVELTKALKREFGGGIRLPSTLVFDHPTISAIATLLHRLLGLDPAAARPEAKTPEPVVAPAGGAAKLDEAEVADLSEDEVNKLLLERLQAMSE